MILNKQGATSVLIILLMVVLMVFGVTILTTTLANQNLSDKKLTWLKDYYELESEVAMNLADIDHQMSKMKMMANDDVDLGLLYAEHYDITKENTYTFDVFESAEDQQKYITVTLQLNMDVNSKQNYEIIEYSETQALFEYEDIPIANPFLPGQDD